MRNLTNEEIEQALDDNGEPDEGCIAIEASVEELSDQGVGTLCGLEGNTAFSDLVIEGFRDRQCRGWYCYSDRVVMGMFHIQCKDDEEAQRISDVVFQGSGGSLRPNGPSGWLGFYEFEIE
jgi:hypothetical protein